MQLDPEGHETPIDASPVDPVGGGLLWSDHFDPFHRSATDPPLLEPKNCPTPVHAVGPEHATL